MTNRGVFFIEGLPLGWVEVDGRKLLVYPSKPAILGFQKITELVGGAQGILPDSVANGVTNGIVYVNAAGGLSSTGAATDGQLPIGNTGDAPTLATLTGATDEIKVTNGAGTITIGLANPLIETKGGTGQAAYAIGDLLYGDAANSLGKLAGNTTTTKRYLSQTGDGAASAAPAWDDAPASGTFTPTLTNTTNVAASTAYQWQYLLVGNTVVASGPVDVNPTGAGQVVLGISLPVASNFGAIEDCSGGGNAIAVAGQSAGIYADTANNRATLEWIAVDTANRRMMCWMIYQVI